MKNISYRHDIVSMCPADGWHVAWWVREGDGTVAVQSELLAVWALVRWEEDGTTYTNVVGLYPGECGLEQMESKDQFLGYFRDGEDAELYRKQAESDAAFYAEQAAKRRAR